MAATFFNLNFPAEEHLEKKNSNVIEYPASSDASGGLCKLQAATVKVQLQIVNYRLRLKRVLRTEIYQWCRDSV